MTSLQLAISELGIVDEGNEKDSLTSRKSSQDDFVICEPCMHESPECISLIHVLSGRCKAENTKENEIEKLKKQSCSVYSSQSLADAHPTNEVN